MSHELAKVLDYYGLFEDQPKYKIMCPFHDDINPSMIINLDENNFYCFGCQVSGDAFKFTRLINKEKDDLKAYIIYNNILNSRKQVKLKTRTVIKHVDNKQALIEAKDYYNGLRRTNWYKDDSEVKKYLLQRGFTAKSLNISKAKFNYNNSYPIVFPMLDNGDFKGWVSRTINPEIEKKRKYLYNTGFSRRSTLVGTYTKKTIVIVEGYMDWLKMVQNGLTQVVAILGWKITSNQIEKLKNKGVKNIISALDNDTCGKNGTKYLSGFFNVMPFYFPDKIKDPGDLDLKTFKKCLAKTKENWRNLK